MGRRVLIAEDDGGVAGAAVRVLEAAGATVVLTSSGREALEKFDEAHFDLVLLDISLPDISGLDILRAMRGHDKAVPIVIMSGYPPPAKELGAMTQFLRKPFSRRELLDIINGDR